MHPGRRSTRFPLSPPRRPTRSTARRGDCTSLGHLRKSVSVSYVQPVVAVLCALGAHFATKSRWTSGPPWLKLRPRAFAAPANRPWPISPSPGPSGPDRESSRTPLRGPHARIRPPPAARRSRLLEAPARWLREDLSTTAFLLTRLMTCAALLLTVLWLAWRAKHSDDPACWRRVAFLSLAWLCLLSPTQKPWYWTWALPLVMFAQGRAWLALSGLAMIYYRGNRARRRGKEACPEPYHANSGR